MSFGLSSRAKGTSMVKCITPVPCIGLSENDSKLHTNFEFYEGKIINI